MAKETIGEWKFDLNKWTLEDFLDYSDKENLRERLPLLQQVIVGTPMGGDIDLSTPEGRRKVTLMQWAEAIKAFNKVTEAAFQ